MNKQKGNSIILILCLLGLAIGVTVILGGVWYKKNVIDNYNLANKTSQATPNPARPGKPTTSTTQTSTDFPLLPEEFVWEERNIGLAEAAQENYKIYYDNRIEIPQPKPQDLYSGEILVTGKEYTTKTTLQTLEETYTSPYDTYMKNLEEAGWVWRKDIYPFVLVGTMADGPFGSQISGFLKGDDKAMRTVILSRYTEGSVVNHFDGYPPSLECPCTYTIKIFQSYPIVPESNLP